MTHATFVLSTGRCATQWLAATLARAFGAGAEVTHEPLHDAYSPRLMLAAGDPHRLPDDVAQPILAHLEHIEETLQSRHYVECGFPSWSTIPYVMSRFAGRVRIIHLTRHPVPTAISWVTQTAFTPPILPHLPQKILLSPFDEGVTLVSYRERWATLAPYEKALFYWAEVHGFALRLEERSEVPWRRVAAESLLSDGAAIDGLMHFIGVAVEEDRPSCATVDEYRFVTRSWSDPRRIADHAEVTSIATALGYDPLAFDAEQLERRYRTT